MKVNISMGRIVRLFVALLFLPISHVAVAENVILFLGDGMGISTITAARIYAGQQQGLDGEEYNLAFDQFPNTALVKTYNTDSQVPDSAGTISAILTGVKTRIGVIGVPPTITRGDCQGSLEQRVPTILELAEAAGYATGIVSTARITHATPAGTYAHVPDRNWESDTVLPEAAKSQGCTDIAAQLVNFSEGDGIDVILGGGRGQFMLRNQVDPEFPNSSGHRQDVDLISTWLKGAEERYYYWNQKGVEGFKPGPNKQLMGLFQPSHMQFEADRENDPGGEPSLADMTELAIRQLSLNEKGFFLLVEGGRIDHAHHFGNAYRALVDTVAMSDAVKRAIEMTKARDTLTIVTADHSHTLTISGYPPRGNPILGKVTINPVMPNAKDTIYTTLAYANGPGYQTPYPDLADVDTQSPDYRQLAAVPLAIETHAGEDVAAFAHGKNASSIRGVMEQNKLFDAMHAVLFGAEASKH